MNIVLIVSVPDQSCIEVTITWYFFYFSNSLYCNINRVVQTETSPIAMRHKHHAPVSNTTAKSRTSVWKSKVTSPAAVRTKSDRNTDIAARVPGCIHAGVFIAAGQVGTMYLR